MADDLAFTFDTSFFDKGIKKVLNGFDTMQTKASTVAKGVTKGLTSFISKLGLVALGFKAIKSAMNNMPEIGQAFGIAKDIFTKNLLYPLRKEIFPLLQKMLDWVRDNRTQFVKWGAALANIFRAVVSGIKKVIGFIKEMSSFVVDFISKIFGDQINSIEELFNIMSFKFAVVVEFVEIIARKIASKLSGIFAIFTQSNEEGDSFMNILTTIADLFGKIVGFVFEMSSSFLDGFIPAISQIMTPIQNIADAFLSIFDSIFGSNEAMSGWSDLFAGLGDIVGTALVKAFEFIADVLTDIADTITMIKEFGVGEALKQKFVGSLQPWVKDLFGIEDEIQDGIVKPDGTVIKTDPKDTLVAMKDQDTSLSGLVSNVSSSSSSVQKTITVPIDFTGMVIQVQEGGVQEGQEFATGLIEQMRNEINSEFERFGE